MQYLLKLNDREYFLNNPKRELRLRVAMSDEFPDDQAEIEKDDNETVVYVLVMKLSDTERIRIPVAITDDDESENSEPIDDEETCSHILEMLTKEVSVENLTNFYSIDMDTIH